MLFWSILPFFPPKEAHQTNFDPKIVSCQFLWPYKYLFEGSWLSNEPLVSLLWWPTSQSRPKITYISQFPIETKVYLNDFSSDIFKSLNVDNQISLSCGQDEPLGCPKNAFFSCVIGIYFVSFFFDHPVC